MHILVFTGAGGGPYPYLGGSLSLRPHSAMLEGQSPSFPGGSTQEHLWGVPEQGAQPGVGSQLRSVSARGGPGGAGGSGARGAQLERKSMVARTVLEVEMSMAVTLISVSPNCMLARISRRARGGPPVSPSSRLTVPQWRTPGSVM